MNGINVSTKVQKEHVVIYVLRQLIPFQDRQFCQICFASPNPSEKVFTLKEKKNAPYGSKFFPVREDLFSEGFRRRRNKQDYTKVVCRAKHVSSLSTSLPVIEYTSKKEHSKFEVITSLIKTTRSIGT